MQGGIAVVFGQALVLVSFTGKLDTGVLGQRDAQRLPMKLLATQVAHGCNENINPYVVVLKSHDEINR